MIIYKKGESTLNVFTVLKISVEEVLEFYLEVKGDLKNAQDLVEKYGLKMSRIWEWQLFQNNYIDEQLLKCLLDDYLLESSDSLKLNDILRKQMNIILKHEIFNVNSLKMILEATINLLLKKQSLFKTQQSSDMNQLDQSCLK